MNLPQQYITNMKALLGSDFQKYTDALDCAPVSGMRINPLKSTPNVQQHFNVLGKVPYTTNGYIIESSKIGKDPYTIAGAVYVQEPSSMMPVAASNLEAEPIKDLKVLDLCAAPGGKSGQIAEILGGEGVLVSNEIEKKRARVLQGNIERMGYNNVIITCASPAELAKSLPAQFDYIFVDAPCGGEGMFRKDPQTIDEWKAERLLSNSERQKEILSHADKMLKKGGKLIYSTCTFAKIEDEDVAMWFSKKFGYKMLDVPQDVKDSTTFLSSEYCRRFYPFLASGEGQFVCVMQKESQSQALLQGGRLPQLSHGETKLYTEFLNQNFDFPFEPIFAKIGQNCCIINQKLAQMLSNLQKISVVNAGVTLGTIEKGRVIPHNNLFSAYGEHAKFIYDFTPNHPQLAKYLHGEVLQNNGFSNYVCISVDGLAIGGAKVSQNQLKNLFPKGLRI